MWLVLASFAVGLVASYAAYQLVSQPPKQFSKPIGIGEVTVPTAEEGREIPVIFGTVEQGGANVVWYGDFATTPTGNGHKYYLGIHMVLCHGDIDAITEVKFDKKSAWRGRATDSSKITINQEKLFGGHTREGGVSGVIDLIFGSKIEGINFYLVKRLNDIFIPAFRGVVSVVFNKFYFGTSPYLKPVSFKIQRVYNGDRDTQWYSEKAGIMQGNRDKQGIYIAIDVSANMAGARLNFVKSEVRKALAELYDLRQLMQIDVHLVAFGNLTAGGSMQYDYFQSDANNRQALQDWVDALSAGTYGAYFPAGLQPLTNAMRITYGKNLRGFFITCGSPTERPGFRGVTTGIASQARLYLDLLERSATAEQKAQWGALNLRAIVIDRKTDPIESVKIGNTTFWVSDTNHAAKVDRTGKGVLRLSSSEANSLSAAITGDITVSSVADMNPVHILWECLTNNVWGMGYQPSDIDQESFTWAADTLYDEKFGLSLVWDKQMPIENFIQEICRHIDATLFVDRETGKFKIKLIRADYNTLNLLRLDEDSISQVDNVSRVSQGELLNSLTVNYTSGGRQGSVTVHDTALFQMHGRVSNATMHYPGVATKALAERIARRDLRALANPRLSCVVVADRKAASLNVGDVFRLHWPDLGIEDVVMRVVTISLGDGLTNSVRVTATEDTFGLPAVDLIVPARPPNIDVDIPYIPRFTSSVFEIPYGLLVREHGVAKVNRLLQGNPGLSVSGAFSNRPDEETSFDVTPVLATMEPGAGYREILSFSFSPVAETVGAIKANQKTIQLTNEKDLELVRVSSVAMVGTELVRVDEVDVEGRTVTLARGVFDTVPQVHAEGTLIHFFGDYFASDWLEHTAGEVEEPKVVAVSGEGSIDEGMVESLPVHFQGRASLPYPPGNVKFGGEAFPDEVTFPISNPQSTLLIEWDHRSREAQGAFPYAFDEETGLTEAEAGCEYEISIYRDGALAATHRTTDNWMEVPLGAIAPGTSTPARIAIRTVRGAVSSQVAFEHSFTATREALVPDKALAEGILQKMRHWWTFREADLSFKDEVGGIDLVATGPVSAAGPIRAGGASAHFEREGRARFFPIPVWMTAPDRTISFSAWVHAQKNAKAVLWHDFNEASGEGPNSRLNLGLILDYDNGMLQVSWYAGDSTYSTDIPVDDLAYGPGLLTVVRDAQTKSLRVYVNGENVFDENYILGPEGGQEAFLVLGGRPLDIAGGKSPITGMQDPMFCDKPLTEEEIVLLYNGGDGWSYQDLYDLANS